ncbi:MAG: acetyltransferase [Bacteroidetes bacterium HGW-Bacteroidetes-12]|nr:MAG: acetyltransferase [Bacteroidetes bacterium HGW-Bacteroidetes-12]
MKNLFAIYGLFGIFQLIYFRIRTKILFKNARLIRFPIRIRGKKFISVGKGFTTGFNCRLDAFSEDGNNCIKIGENVQINDYVHIGAVKSIEIGDNVLIASKVYIADHNHGNYSEEECDCPMSIPKDRKLYSKKVVIEKNVWIGEFVSILPGVIIGEGSIIGTMSVVNKDIPPYSIAVGSPAKVIKRYNYETKLWEKV